MLSYNQLQTMPSDVFQGSFQPDPNDRRVIYVCGQLLFSFSLFICVISWGRDGSVANALVTPCKGLKFDPRPSTHTEGVKKCR